MQSPTSPILKIAIMGPGGVGKTALTLVYMYDEFNEDYEPTKADSYRKNTVLNGENIRLDILDTAGQEDHACVVESHFKATQGALFVFDATSTDPIEDLSRLWDTMSRAKPGEYPIVVVVANKMDMKEQINQSTLNNGRQFAEQHKLKFIETSAKTGTNVDHAFRTLAQDIRQRDLASAQSSKPSRKKAPRKRCVLL